MNFATNQLSSRPDRQTVTIEKPDRDAQIQSLRHLYELTQKHGQTGQTRVIARFLACLYNGYRFQFDLTDFRLLDSEIVEHCLNVLRLDAQPAQEVHCYFERGSELWERMIREYDLEDKTSAKALAGGD